MGFGILVYFNSIFISLALPIIIQIDPVIVVQPNNANVVIAFGQTR